MFKKKYFSEHTVHITLKISSPDHLKTFSKKKAYKHKMYTNSACLFMFTRSSFLFVFMFTLIIKTLWYRTFLFIWKARQSDQNSLFQILIHLSLKRPFSSPTSAAVDTPRMHAVLIYAKQILYTGIDIYVHTYNLSKSV